MDKSEIEGRHVDSRSDVTEDESPTGPEMPRFRPNTRRVTTQTDPLYYEIYDEDLNQYPMHLSWSFVAMALGVFPLGFVGYHYATKASQAAVFGRRALAEKHARTAKYWNIASIVLNIVLYLGPITYYFFPLFYSMYFATPRGLYPPMFDEPNANHVL